MYFLLHSKIPKRVKSFFTDGVSSSNNLTVITAWKMEQRLWIFINRVNDSLFQSLETLRAQEEARSKRHSTSELGTITFSDVRKEGWLHYKQILTEKGKVRP